MKFLSQLTRRQLIMTTRERLHSDSIFRFLLLMLAFEALTQSRVAKCETNTTSHEGGSNATAGRDHDIIDHNKSIYSSLVKILHIVKQQQQVDPLNQNPLYDGSLRADDRPHLELERSDKVAAAESRADLTTSTSTTTTTTTTIKPMLADKAHTVQANTSSKANGSNQAAAAATSVVTMDVWGENWATKLPAAAAGAAAAANQQGIGSDSWGGQSKSAVAAAAANKTAELQLADGKSARVQKKLSFPETASHTIFSPSKIDTGGGLLAKTWHDKHERRLMSSTPSQHDEDSAGLFRISSSSGTSPSPSVSSSSSSLADLSPTSVAESTSTENYDSSGEDQFSPLNNDEHSTESGFKPLTKLDYQDAENMLYETTLPTEPPRKQSKQRGHFKSGRQKFSPQYSSWRSEILNQPSKSTYLWPNARLASQGAQKLAATSSLAASLPDSSEEDSSGFADERKHRTTGVLLRQVNAATQPQRTYHQPPITATAAAAYDQFIRQALDRASSTTRLDPSTVLFGSAGSQQAAPVPTAAATTAYDPSGQSAAAAAANGQRDLQNQPQTIQITAVPNGRLLNNGPLVRLAAGWNGVNALNSLGFNGANTVPFAGAAGGYLDALGRPMFMVNAERRQIDWSFWIWPIIALVSLPLVLGALFVPIFLKSIVILIQVLQSLGLLLPFSLTQQLTQAASGVLSASSLASQLEQMKT